MKVKFSCIPKFLNQIADLFKVHPVVALLGPRQAGKTTLAKMYAGEINDETAVTQFDLEDPMDLSKLETPKLALESLKDSLLLTKFNYGPIYSRY